MTATLHVAHCQACGSWTFPAQAWGCRVCGAAPDQLHTSVPPTTPTLCNAVTVHAELAPGLPVPCVIGEVELAPGVVEEAWIDVAAESALHPGMVLRAEGVADVQGTIRWRFVPAEPAR